MQSSSAPAGVQELPGLERATGHRHRPSSRSTPFGVRGGSIQVASGKAEKRAETSYPPSEEVSGSPEGNQRHPGMREAWIPRARRTARMTPVAAGCRAPLKTRSTALSGAAGSLVPLNCRTIRGPAPNLSGRSRPLPLTVCSSADALSYIAHPDSRLLPGRAVCGAPARQVSVDLRGRVCLPTARRAAAARGGTGRSLPIDRSGIGKLRIAGLILRSPGAGRDDGSGFRAFARLSGRFMSSGSDGGNALISLFCAIRSMVCAICAPVTSVVYPTRTRLVAGRAVVHPVQVAAGPGDREEPPAIAKSSSTATSEAANILCVGSSGVSRPMGAGAARQLPR